MSEAGARLRRREHEAAGRCRAHADVVLRDQLGRQQVDRTRQIAGGLDRQPERTGAQPGEPRRIDVPVAGDELER